MWLFSLDFAVLYIIISAVIIAITVLTFYVVQKLLNFILDTVLGLDLICSSFDTWLDIGDTLCQARILRHG